MHHTQCSFKIIRGSCQFNYWFMTQAFLTKVYYEIRLVFRDPRVINGLSNKFFI
jgi:hypothetical protein